MFNFTRDWAKKDILIYEVLHGKDYQLEVVHNYP